jgi:hypothetical protein
MLFIFHRKARCAREFLHHGGFIQATGPARRPGIHRPIHCATSRRLQPTHPGGRAFVERQSAAIPARCHRPRCRVGHRRRKAHWPAQHLSFNFGHGAAAAYQDTQSLNSRHRQTELFAQNGWHLLGLQHPLTQFAVHPIFKHPIGKDLSSFLGLQYDQQLFHKNGLRML